MLPTSCMPSSAVRPRTSPCWPRRIRPVDAWHRPAMSRSSWPSATARAASSIRPWDMPPPVQERGLHRHVAARGGMGGHRQGDAEAARRFPRPRHAGLPSVVRTCPPPYPLRLHLEVQGPGDHVVARAAGSNPSPAAAPVRCPTWPGSISMRPCGPLILATDPAALQDGHDRAARGVGGDAPAACRPAAEPAAATRRLRWCGRNWPFSPAGCSVPGLRMGPASTATTRSS